MYEKPDVMVNRWTTFSSFSGVTYFSGDPSGPRTTFFRSPNSSMYFDTGSSREITPSSMSFTPAVQVATFDTDHIRYSSSPDMGRPASLSAKPERWRNRTSWSRVTMQSFPGTPSATISSRCSLSLSKFRFPSSPALGRIA